jgi:hypothetical protein
MINGKLGYDGSIVWLYGRATMQDTYNTNVEYHCANGSQFNTESGSQTNIKTRCQWNKKWSPYHDSLPQCVVTHCIVPFTIPEDTFLEEVTSAWTLVGEDKLYRCQGMKSDGTHTRFWETDRTKSTFQMKCMPDGSYQFEGKRENWPTCLEGEQNKTKLFKPNSSDILCKNLPPIIPTDPEYSIETVPGVRDLVADDGAVTVTSMIYPALERTQDYRMNSTMENTDIPRNYMANLT